MACHTSIGKSPGSKSIKAETQTYYLKGQGNISMVSKISLRDLISRLTILYKPLVMVSGARRWGKITPG